MLRGEKNDSFEMKRDLKKNMSNVDEVIHDFYGLCFEKSQK